MGDRNRGYLLPSGSAFTDEMRCCFVYIPDKDEYQRAFFGALDYFATWLAWERDDLKRGKDAASSWKLANELTRECWEMGTCDLMIAELEHISTLLENKVCCSGEQTINYVDNRIETTTISPNVGTVPSTWGETAVSDWDEWLEYVCYHAHQYVDSLINMAEKIDSLLDLGIFVIDSLAWLLGVSMFRNDNFTVPVDITWVGTIFKAVLQGGAGYFDIIMDDLESGREDIVCAFINDTSIEDAVESAIGGTTAWTLLYQFLDYESIKAIVYEGGIDGMGYLTPTKRDDCTCVILPDYQLVENFTTIIPAQWDLNSVDWNAGYGGSMYFNNGSDWAKLNKTGINTYAGTSGISYYCDRIKVSWRRSTTNTNPYLKITHNDGITYKYWDTLHPGVATYLSDEFTFSPALYLVPGDVIQFAGYNYNNYGNIGLFEMDLWINEP